MKDQGEEEVGKDEYYDQRHPEEDPVFKQITNLKVRKLLKEIYELYKNAKDDLDEKDIF